MIHAIINKMLTITDNVQGVTQFLVERKINTGSFETVTVPPELNGDPSGYYLCPSLPDPITELEVYSFSYQEIISDLTFSIDDVIQWRFSPAGYDEGNGSSFLSEEYLVTEGILRKDYRLTGYSYAY